MWTITKLFENTRRYEVLHDAMILLRRIEQGWTVLSESETEKIKRHHLYIATRNIRKFGDNVA
jgi:hypothetical protein